MARRKKHPRLPNGLGSIRYLGRHRKHPYAVHPPQSQIWSLSATACWQTSRRTAMRKTPKKNPAPPFLTYMSSSSTENMG